MYIVYKLTSPSNKSYIGVTTRTFEQRLNEHTKRAYLDKNDHIWFYQAIRKYGIDNFTIEILRNDITDKKVLEDTEIFYINLYNTYNNGYNMDRGGRGIDRVISQNTRNKISKSVKLYKKNNIDKVCKSAQKSADNRDQKVINEKSSKTKRLSGTGNNGSSQSEIHIFNDKNELVFVKTKDTQLKCLPDFLPPWRRIQHSYTNDSKISKPFSGWYAIKIK